MAYLVGTDSYTEARGGRLEVNMDLTGIPWESGDVAILWACGNDNQSGGGWQVIEPGWDIVVDVSATSGADRLAGMFWKELVISENETPFFEVDTPTSGTDTMTAILGVFRGVLPTFDLAASSAPSAGNDSATPAITTTLPETFIVSAYYHRAAETGPIAPAGYTLMTAFYETVWTTLAYTTKLGAGLETPGNWGSVPAMGVAEEIQATAAWGNAVTELEAKTVVYTG
jgi:hypothetical protein